MSAPPDRNRAREDGGDGREAQDTPNTPRAHGDVWGVGRFRPPDGFKPGRGGWNSGTCPPSG
ncbi:hypothetical protein Acsp03_47110 [Actinomadura sp. NBRC 104412]|nr:hypothetical protein Acsp03_47110 [Actinomadura sp. NBRC 104412]